MADPGALLDKLYELVTLENVGSLKKYALPIGVGLGLTLYGVQCSYTVYKINKLEDNIAALQQQEPVKKPVKNIEAKVEAPGKKAPAPAQKPVKQKPKVNANPDVIDEEF